MSKTPMLLAWTKYNELDYHITHKNMTNKALVASHIPTSQIVDILTKPLLCNSNTIVWFKLGVYCIPFPNLERMIRNQSKKLKQITANNITAEIFPLITSYKITTRIAWISLLLITTSIPRILFLLISHSSHNFPITVLYRIPS